MPVSQSRTEHFKTLFFDEAAEHLAEMESGLLSLEAGDVRPEVVHAVFRAAHSIKGVSGSLGLSAIAEFTHLLESVLGQLRDGVLAPQPKILSVLLQATDALRTLVHSAATGGSATDVRAVTEDLRAVMGEAVGKSTPSETTAPLRESPSADHPRLLDVRIVPSPDCFGSGQDPLLLVRELVALGTLVDVSTDCSALPALPNVDPHRCYLSWTVRLSTAATREELAEVFAFVDDSWRIEFREREADRATAPEKSVAPVAPPVASVRVAATKIDALVDLVGEMIITQAMVIALADDLPLDRASGLRDALAALERQTRDLQLGVMAVRMLPVETIFSRFTRVVRDVSAQLGKRVKLAIEGADTELDRAMLERLGDPLTHLVRNAIDHGIESAEVRRAAGKPVEATVTLRAYHESGRVVIEVADDGRGLDTARIRARATERGLLDGAEDSLSESEIQALIFEPGFSTAAAVTDVSGRGVGMDVVKRTVDALKGSIAITSTAGRGTMVQLRLPLTLAVLDGLVVRVGSEDFVVPIGSIAESLRPSRRDVFQLLDRGEMIELRGDCLPFVRLGQVFGLPAAVREPSEGIVVIVETHGRRFGLLVDDVIGEQQVVIKNLERHFRKVNGAMAATILGDGQVSLIVDVDQLGAASMTHGSRMRTCLPS